MKLVVVVSYVHGLYIGGCIAHERREAGLTFLVSLRVFRTKRHYVQPPRYHLECHSKKFKNKLCHVHSEVVSFRGQLKLEPRPDWFPLWV